MPKLCNKVFNNELPSSKTPKNKDETPYKRTSVLKNGRFQGRKPMCGGSLLLLCEVYANLVVVVALCELCDSADFVVLLAQLLNGFL